MKKVKTILLSGVLTLGVFSMVAYTSCSKKDKCESITCKNGGTCNDGVCKCPVGFEGVNCETASNKKFIGQFNAKDNCPVSGSTSNYVLTINPANNSATELYVLNLGNPGLPPSDYLTAKMTSSKELEIEPKTLTDGRIYSGTIKFVSTGKLSATFQIKDANDNIIDACNSSLTKN